MFVVVAVVVIISVCFIHSTVATHAAPPFWRLFDLTVRVM